MRASLWRCLPELVNHPKFRIVGVLGRGGMGVVYKAEHRIMKRPVAIKVINKGLLENAEALQRFAAEVQAAAKLNHPNIVQAFDAEQAGDLHFLVMEFVEGKSLAELLEKRQKAAADPARLRICPSSRPRPAARSRTADGAPGHQAAQSDAHAQGPTSRSSTSAWPEWCASARPQRA